MLLGLTPAVVHSQLAPEDVLARDDFHTGFSKESEQNISTHQNMFLFLYSFLYIV